VRNQSSQQAIDQLRQLLKIPSRHRNPHLHAQLGLQLKKQGAYKEATEELEIAVKLKPNSIYFRTQLAFCYSKQEAYHKSLPLLEQVFEIRSEDTQIIGAMAKAYFHLGELDRAKQSLTQAIKKAPHDRYLRSVWAHIKQQQMQG
jgi:tetratricopeptide (TPR) repeat protein